MKRVYALLIAIIAAVLLVSPILAAYYATFTVTESDGNAYTMLPVMVDSPNTWMVNNGFMQADAMDTRVETLGGTAQPHMVTDNRVLSALAVPDNSQTNLYFTTQESTNLTSMDIITGYNGYVTTSDAAALEISDNFSIEWNGYIDTSANGTTKYLVEKDESIGVFVSPTTAGNITALTYQAWLTPTGDNDPSGQWSNDSNIRDNNTGTFAQDNMAGAGWSEYIEATIAPTSCTRIRFWADYLAGTREAVDVDVYYGAAWHSVYDGDGFTDLGWTNVSLNGSFALTAMRFRQYYAAGGAGVVALYEVDFGPGDSVTATGVTSAEHSLVVSSNTTLLYIYVDGVESDNATFTGAIDDTANDWVWMQNNVMPYADNITLDVDGVRQLYYCPNTMILTTVLPDREGVAQNGAITWGANPSGVAVALGSLVSDAQPVVGSTIDETPRDIIEEVEVSDWFEAPDVGGTLLTNPMRPFVTMMSDTTTITELQAWRLLGLAFVLLCTAGAAALARGHLLIVGIAGGAAIGACCALTIFPLWMLIFAIGAVAGGLVAERSPSL